MLALKKGKECAAELQQTDERRYPTGKLLASRHLAGYQQDFARAILTEPEYTISGALEALNGKLKGGQ